MSGLDRAAAVDRVEALVDTVESTLLPVPVREVWVYGDLALGLDPVDRLDIYLTKDVLLRDNPDAEATFEARHGVKGVGKSVRAEWATRHPDFIRANTNGHAAPERCLAAHLLEELDTDSPPALESSGDGDDSPPVDSDDTTPADGNPQVPIHLEVCNASFEDNVTQRLRGAQLREDYTQLLDPRGVCLWAEGVRSEEAFRKLRASELAFPTLSGALEMLGMDDEEAAAAAEVVHAWRDEQAGVTVRGDVI